MLYEDGSAALRDISSSGIGIEGRSHRLRPGQALRMLISIGSRWYGPFECEVVWAKGSRAGLRILECPEHWDIRELIHLLRSSSSPPFSLGGRFVGLSLILAEIRRLVRSMFMALSGVGAKGRPERPRRDAEQD